MLFFGNVVLDAAGEEQLVMSRDSSTNRAGHKNSYFGQKYGLWFQDF